MNLTSWPSSRSIKGHPVFPAAKPYRHIGLYNQFQLPSPPVPPVQSPAFHSPLLVSHQRDRVVGFVASCSGRWGLQWVRIVLSLELLPPHRATQPTWKCRKCIPVRYVCSGGSPRKAAIHRRRGMTYRHNTSCLLWLISRIPMWGCDALKACILIGV